MNAAELECVTYLDVSSVQGRNVNLMPYWDGERWRSWIPTEKGLIAVRPHDVALGNYVAKAPILESDLRLKFVEFMWQRASWNSIVRYISAIVADFHNLATSCAKMDLFFEERAKIGIGVGDFVATELEYIVISVRGIIDLLYDATRTLWKHHVLLADERAEARRKGATPHVRFSRFILAADGVAHLPGVLIDKYGFPEPIAEAYVALGRFLVPVRRLRDEILHHGKPVPTIFVTDQGFCLDRKAKTQIFDVWNDSHEFGTNGLVSLRPLLAHLVFGCLGTCGLLATAFERTLQFPPPLAPGYKIFLRGHHSASLLPLLDLVNGGSPWWAEASTSTAKPLGAAVEIPMNGEDGA